MGTFVASRLVVGVYRMIILLVAVCVVAMRALSVPR